MSNTDVDFKTLVQGRAGVQHKSAGPETKEFPALLAIKSVDVKNRRITALASTGSIDRDNEIILPEAFRESLPIYMNNPVVLCSHQHRLETGHSTVVANVIEAKITKEGLEVVLEFHCLTELSREYWDLYSRKKQKALSVGFIAQEGGYEEKEGRRVYVHSRIEWIDLSVCPIGSNRDALSRAKQKKLAWLDNKKEQGEMDELERELLKLDPDFNVRDFRKNADELVELWLGEESKILDNEVEESCDLDCAGIVKGTACGEYAALIRRQ